MENITHRIKIIADNENIKITQLESKIGASKGVLSRSLANGTDIQSKWITSIVENYPKYNSEWLLTGRGKMIIDYNFQPEIDQISEFNEPISFYKPKCNSCGEKNEIIALLKKMINDKDKIISLLEKQAISK